MVNLEAVLFQVKFEESIRSPAVDAKGTRPETSEETRRFVVEAVVEVIAVVEANGKVLNEAELLLNIPSAVKLPVKYPAPATLNVEAGLVVPMPTLPPKKAAA